MQKIVTSIQNILENLIDDCSQSLGQLTSATRAEIETISAWNSTNAEYPDGSNYSEIFAQIASRNTTKTAAFCDGNELSYGDLDTQSNQLANLLIGKGVQQGDLVGILLDRSLDMLVSCLAIWKAGAAYVPLDPEYPLNRLEYMIDTADIQLIVSDEKYESIVTAKKL